MSSSELTRYALKTYRTVPTEASRLKRAMSEMEDRIKELETAVTSACGYHLNHCPLLGIPPQSDSSADQLADSLGALSVNDTGDTQYFGPTAGTEVCVAASCGRIQLSQTRLGIAIGESHLMTCELH